MSVRFSYHSAPHSSRLLQAQGIFSQSIEAQITERAQHLARQRDVPAQTDGRVKVLQHNIPSSGSVFRHRESEIYSGSDPSTW